MKKRITTLLMTALLAIGMCSTVFAANESFEDSARNVFITGDLVSFPDSRFFSGFAVGQNVEMTDSSAVGSVIMMGPSVLVKDSEIGESVYLGGTKVVVDGVMASGNLLAAGTSVEITDDSSANAVYAFGNHVSFDGEADYAYLAGTSVVLGGTINGDVKIKADSVEVLKGTVVKGELVIECAKEPDMPENAEIGEYTYNQVSNEDDFRPSFGTIIYGKITSGLYWIIAMGAFGMLLCWLFAEHLDRAGRYIKNRTTAMVLSGILSWLMIPVLALLLLISVIFAPISGMLIAAYVLLLCAGLAFAGASIGRLVFPNMNRFLAAFIGIAALEVLRLIPVIGFIIGAAADMYLLGYVIQYLWLHRVQKISDK